MCDCLLQNSVSLSFLTLSLSTPPESRLSSRQDTASPTDTACSSESPAFLGPASHLLLYDQNSSEEELEVINGGVLEVGSETDGDGGGDGGGGGADCASGISAGSSESVNQIGTIARITSRQHRALAVETDGSDGIDDCTDELCLTSPTSPTVGLLRPLAVTPNQLGAVMSKRCSSNNLLEKRKRSLAHSSDDEVRHLLEHQQHQQQHHHHQHHHHHHHHHQHHQQPLMSAPVNFRTSPPLEALKPHRGHIIQRSTTPLILTDSGRGLEHIRISSSSSISSTTSSLSSLGGGAAGGSTIYGGGVGGLPPCDSPATVNYGTGHQPQHHNHHQQHHHQQQQPAQNSNNLALLSTTNASTASGSNGSGASTVVTAAGTLGMAFGQGQDPPGGTMAGTAAVASNNMEISRSVSPPAKVFHCAVSPRRRQPRHQQQRLQRPHRPCLDFDKMQQLKARSVTTWRHSNEHSGELSVFCW
ncbi:dendritic arbor reduction protein 1-like isoform X2 [Sabethes cyaneus]|uniref:dendritic arbor reduction protein 1-like isoform X2 n=1 Tax=Sabethes cyaneus TaxID=53552 RepID=UPI00237D6FCC|nr:dendritic arbor reduction protein 1-like isoform X2 [Sabethes cyaneus]